MKKRQMKLTACLLAGMVLVTSAAVAPTYAAEGSSNLIAQGTGLSLALSGVESTSGNMQALQESVAQATKAQEQAEQEKYASIGVAQVDNYLRVRSAATTDSDVVGCMENNAVATVEGEENGWYKITSGSISGYVLKDYMVVGNKELVDSALKHVAVVQSDSVNIRSEATTESSILTKANTGDSFEVLDTATEGWVKVSTSAGEGYVSADYVTLTDSYLYAKEPQEVTGGQAVAEYGLQFVGNPYVWGGTSLTNGADCSGFVMSVYAHFGVSLPHSSSALRNVGTKVDYSEAQPGDIICYSGHVGIYIGNGLVVHAANKNSGIIVSSATHKKILTVRRIFQ